MTRYTKIAAAAAAALLAAPVFAAMTMDANLELDSDFRSKIEGHGKSGNSAVESEQTSTGGFGQGLARNGSLSQPNGRVEFNVAGKAGDTASGFVAGRGTLLIKRDGTAGVDDMWGQIGIDMVDVKLGRFEATDMFPPGKDTLVEDGANAAGGTRTNALRGRTGNGEFHGALTINPGAGVGIEVGLVESKKDGATRGIRPVVSFAAGPVSVKVGAEFGKVNGTAKTFANPAVDGQKFTSLGATVGGNFEGVGFNVNVGTRKLKATAAAPEVKSTSFGANATFGPAGVGVVFDTDKVDVLQRKHTDQTFYAAYSIPLFNTGATLTPALSYQTGKRKGANVVGGPVTDDKYKAATSARVRLNYTF